MYRMTGAARCVESLTRVVWRNKSDWWLFGPSIYIFFVGSQTAIFVPRGKCSDWIFINVFFFLLIYRKWKFCAEPMRERLTFHFQLRTRSVNFRFFFSFFFSFFLFFQIKARSRLVTAPLDLTMIWGCYVVSACLRACFCFVWWCVYYLFCFLAHNEVFKACWELPSCCSFHWVLGIVSGTAVICDKMLPWRKCRELWQRVMGRLPGWTRR